MPNGDAVVPRASVHYETMSWLSYYNETVPIGGVSDWDQQKAYHRTDLSLVYKGQGDKKYEVEAYVKNVENNNIKTNAGVDDVLNVPYPTAIYQPPRTWGIKLRYSF
jgi:iron complex outermembrane receptor protein